MSDGAGDEVAAALTEKETDGLNDRHQGKHHAHRTGGGIAFQHPHKKGVCHVVKGSHQHTHDTGQRQPQDQRPHRRFRHLPVLFYLLFVQGYPSYKNKSANFVYHSTFLTGWKPFPPISRLFS